MNFSSSKYNIESLNQVSSARARYHKIDFFSPLIFNKNRIYLLTVFRLLDARCQPRLVPSANACCRKYTQPVRDLLGCTVRLCHFLPYIRLKHHINLVSKPVASLNNSPTLKKLSYVWTERRYSRFIGKGIGVFSTLRIIPGSVVEFGKNYFDPDIVILLNFELLRRLQFAMWTKSEQNEVPTFCDARL